MNQIKKTVKGALRRAFAQKKLQDGLTTRELAKQLGWSQPKVSRMLSPNNPTPLDLEDTALIAAALDCEIPMEIMDGLKKQS